MKRKILSIIMTVAVLAEAVAMMIIPANAASWSWNSDGKCVVATHNSPIVKDGTIIVDAELDDGYLAGTRITSYPDESPYRRPGYEYLWSTAKGDFEAYVSLDTKGMYVYAEIEDSTIHPTTNDDGNDGDFFQIYLDWCTPDIVHPTSAEMYSMYTSGNAFDCEKYKSSYAVKGLQYIGWLSADYYGKVAAAGGFAPYDQLGPNATDSVGYEARFIEGGWACEWFIPWRDQEQKTAIKNGEQFHLGIGLQVGDDTDVDNTRSGEKDVGLCYDQRKEIGLQYWSDYSRLADVRFISACEHDWSITDFVDKTCVANGYMDCVCSKCGGEKTKTVPASHGETVEYVCTVAGKKECVCADCGEILSEGTVTDGAESHALVKSADSKDPTCTEAGYHAVVCKFCDKVESNEILPATGHSYSLFERANKYFCDTCGARAPMGDANGDERITNADVLKIYRYIYDRESYPIEAVALADVNGDGSITNADVLSIYRFIYDPAVYPLEEDETTLDVDGMDIRTYTIVYPVKNQNGEKALAEKLAKHFKDSFGAELPVSTSWDGEGRAIVVGEHTGYITDSYKSSVNVTVNMNNAYVVYAEDILWIAANNSHTAKAATEKLIELTTPVSDEDMTVSFSGAVSVTVTDLGEELKIMSYNVQTGNQTVTRVQNMIKNITDFMPDVLGTQELNYSWIQHLTNQGILDEYTLVGEPRNGNKTTDLSNGNEYSAILFKTSKFNLLDYGTCWLSDTPDVPGSKHSSSTYIRIMTYAVLERKSDGKRFVHVNTHLSWDENGYKTNLIQINIMLDLIETRVYSKHGELPTFFTGDFNVTDSSSGYARLISWGTSDSRRVAESTVTYPTFSGGSIIDFCLVSEGDFIVKKFNVGYGLEGSDHYPVYINAYLN